MSLQNILVLKEKENKSAWCCKTVDS